MWLVFLFKGVLVGIIIAVPDKLMGHSNMDFGSIGTSERKGNNRVIGKFRVKPIRREKKRRIRRIRVKQDRHGLRSLIQLSGSRVAGDERISCFALYLLALQVRERRRQIGPTRLRIVQVHLRQT